MHWFTAPGDWLGRPALPRGLGGLYPVAVLGAAPPVPRAAGPPRAHADPALHRPGPVPAGPEPVPAALLGPVLRRHVLGRGGAVGRAGRGPGRSGPAVGVDA